MKLLAVSSDFDSAIRRFDPSRPIETYLDVITALQTAGLKSKIVFASSNIEDYANERRGVLNPDLQAEFAPLNIEYAPNLSVAKHWLGV